MRSKGSKNKGFWYWQQRGHFVHTPKGTQKRIAIVTDQGQKITGEDQHDLAESNYWRMKLAGDFDEYNEPQTPLEEIARSYVDTLRGIRKKQGRSIIANFLNGFETAEDVTPVYVQKWVKNWNGSTQDTNCDFIRAMFNHACKRTVGLLPSNFDNPAVGIVTEKSKPKDYTFTDREADDIMFEAHPALAFFFKVCLATGARPAEIAAINPEDIRDQDGATIAILDPQRWKNGRKTQKDRVIVFPSSVAGEIVRLAQQVKTGQPVLTTPTGLRWCREAAEDTGGRWGNLIKNMKDRKAFPKGASLYTCRHTAITKAVRETNHSYDILGEYFGTSGAMIKTVYGHLRTDDMVAIMKDIHGA